MESVTRLLKEIQNHGNLRAAASSCHYSYRKAWDILKQFKTLFDSALVDTQQGKGSQLTALGKIILDNAEKNNQLFSSNLTEAASKANTSIHAIQSFTQPVRIIASDSEKLSKLRHQHRFIELHFDGSGQALSAYAEGRCDIAGFHISAKNNNSEQISAYCQHLNQKNDQFILLEKRLQGIISHPERPLQSLRQIIDQQLIFVNRQSGSGTRQLLDLLLQEEDINPEQLNGYYHEEHTHLAIASMISSGQADAGIGIHSAAEHLKLHFTPLCSEYYFLVFKTLSSPIQRILTLLYEQQIPQIMNYNDFIKFITKN
jgi:molybdate transport repressor ModE-like protein